MSGILTGSRCKLRLNLRTPSGKMVGQVSEARVETADSADLERLMDVQSPLSLKLLL